jgi:hypothetical protein
MLSISDDLVYRGCGRSQGARDASFCLFKKDTVGYHAVVYLLQVPYRLCGGAGGGGQQGG